MGIMLGKHRLEGLSDGVFAIVATLLVIEIRVPELHHPDLSELIAHLIELWPLFVGYFVSFAVLAMLWLSHNFFYSAFTKTLNRQLVLLNMLYLSLIALIPFFAHLLGRYVNEELAVFLYGGHIFLIGLLNIIILRYAVVSQEIDTSHVTPRLLAQAKVRAVLTPLFTLFGMGAAFVSIPLALVLFAFPIVFNIVPGTLDMVEKFFGLRLG